MRRCQVLDTRAATARSAGSRRHRIWTRKCSESASSIDRRARRGRLCEIAGSASLGRFSGIARRRRRDDRGPKSRSSEVAPLLAGSGASNGLCSLSALLCGRAVRAGVSRELARRNRCVAVRGRFGTIIGWRAGFVHRRCVLPPPWIRCKASLRVYSPRLRRLGLVHPLRPLRSIPTPLASALLRFSVVVACCERFGLSALALSSS